MPKLNHDLFAQAEVKNDAQEYATLEPGNYLSVIQAVRTKWTDSYGTEWTSGTGENQKTYVKLILDIAEGECAGKFSSEYYSGDERDFMHCLYANFSEKAYPMLKTLFAALDEANHGFDSRAAFEADRFDLFIGKQLRVQWRGEEYTKEGEAHISVRPARALLKEQDPKPRVRLQNSNKTELYEDWKERTKYANARSSSVVTPAQQYDDVPFS